jgi:hypothetical protein
MATELRQWSAGQLVQPADMNNVSFDTYNKIEYYLNPFYELGSYALILSGLKTFTITGNVFTCTDGGAVKSKAVTTSDYPFLPIPYSPPGGPTPNLGYPVIYNVPANTSITLNTATTPAFIVASYSILPTTPGAASYFFIGALQQIAPGSYSSAIHVKLSQVTWDGSNWSHSETIPTNRDADMNKLFTLIGT